MYLQISGLLRYAVWNSFWNISVARNKPGEFTTLSPYETAIGQLTRPGPGNEPLWFDIEQCLRHDNLASDAMTDRRIQKKYPADPTKKPKVKHKLKVGDEAYGAIHVFMFVSLDVHEAQNRVWYSSAHWHGR